MTPFVSAVLWFLVCVWLVMFFQLVMAKDQQAKENFAKMNSDLEKAAETLGDTFRPYPVTEQVGNSLSRSEALIKAFEAGSYNAAPGPLAPSEKEDNSKENSLEGMVFKNLKKTPNTKRLKKLTEDEVIEIITQLSRGQSLRSLAKTYGVCPRTISLIRDRKIWLSAWVKVDVKSSAKAVRTKSAKKQ